MSDQSTTDLEVHVPNGALDLPTVDEWGDVDTGWSGEAPPTTKPIVPRLAFNAKFGEGFTDELTGKKFGEGDTLRAVWLAWSESRAYWKDPFGTGDITPTCRSNSMLAPDLDVEDKQSPSCPTCPLSQWSDGKPPACGVRLSVMLYLPDQQRITRTSFAGLSMKHVQRYLGGFSTRLPQRPPMAFVTEITLSVEETDNGKFLTPNFRVAGEITRAEAAPLIVLRDELRKQWQDLSADDLNKQEATPRDESHDPFPSDADVIDVESFEEAIPNQASLADEEPF